MISPVAEHLREKGVPFREFRHPGAIKSLEQAAAERGQEPDQVIRSILFRVTEGEYVMILVAGPRQIAWPALRKYLGESRISMAKPEEVRRVTGYETGAVSPFGLPRPLRILVDRSVLDQEEVSLGSGVRGTTIFIKVRDLLPALGGHEVASLA